MVLPGMKKKVSLQSLAMHKKVNWYMNKTIIFTSLISQGWIMTMKSHLTISNDRVDVGVKSGGEAKIHLEIQKHMHRTA